MPCAPDRIERQKMELSPGQLAAKTASPDERPVLDAATDARAALNLRFSVLDSEDALLDCPNCQAFVRFDVQNTREPATARDHDLVMTPGMTLGFARADLVAPDAAIYVTIIDNSGEEVEPAHYQFVATARPVDAA